MKLRRLFIKNFRAIDELEIFFQDKITVIVGPNSVGKTTVLEAIRLCKGVLSPRIASEADQILRSLGAILPHQPNQIQLDAVCRDPAIPLKIEIDLLLSGDEIGNLKDAQSTAINSIVQSRIGQQFANPANLVNFLSTPAGLQIRDEVSREVTKTLSKLEKDRQCTLVLTIENGQIPIRGYDPVLQLLIGILDQQLPPGRTKFSYFPADRALPAGEIQIQLGIADAIQQVEAHNSQPHLKYQRLKSVVFNSVIAGETQRRQLDENFSKIFSSLIKELKFAGAGISANGTLSINAKDANGRIFSIDALSSGEKTLLLTFLTIAQTINDRGIVLLDEPEQHLNPAVCKELIPYILENYTKDDKDIQFIICSHSPEVLAGAFGNDGCGLWRIKTASESTEVRIQDHEEVEEALRHLGTSELESLVYQGLIFVEGDDDVAILEAGFNDLLRRHKLIDMGGRPEIEKAIRKLQNREGNQSGSTQRIFIFDRDNKPSELQDSNSVKIRQLGRYCMENYLLDLDVLGDALLSPEICVPAPSISHAKSRIKDVAMGQLDSRALISARRNLLPAMQELSYNQFTAEMIDEFAGSAYDLSKSTFAPLFQTDRDLWVAKFVEEFAKQRSGLESDWRQNWAKHCNGKQLLDDLYISMKPRIKKHNFKKYLIKELRYKNAAIYQELKALILEAVG